ncbi:hypothetical protein [Burkholderia diffusa]|uniref:hypothetical protein n=1 Tax=Burkholderia diffusa TaxID=488732 RepID=UPI001E317E38|nr:hypothetical protein [Burkholderia diffusa]
MLIYFVRCGNVIAAASGIEQSDVVVSYENCTYQEHEDRTFTATMTIHFKAASGHTAGRPFYGRAIIIYRYDSNGRPVGNTGGSVPLKLTMNGREYGASEWVGKYLFQYGSGGVWGNRDEMTVNLEWKSHGKLSEQKYGSSVQAANFTGAGSGPLVVNSGGGAYIGPGNHSGSCVLVDPEAPPPLVTNIKVEAPDWSLGELPRGEGEKVLSSPAQQLCFTYTGAEVAGRSFIINAQNANGVENNRYRLQNVMDPSQLVEYSVKLDSGLSTLMLPNTKNSALPLNGSGKTCFVPTFRTFVDKKLKEGDYSDVLQFTVVTKP